jgi:hypothetical protein
MNRWEMIDVCDALELLSPVFEREEVGLQEWSGVLLLPFWLIRSPAFFYFFYAFCLEELSYELILFQSPNYPSFLFGDLRWDDAWDNDL